MFPLSHCLPTAILLFTQTQARLCAGLTSQLDVRAHIWKAGTIYRIINTTELLENVLSHLPLCDLLHSQGVCRRFRNLIKTSPSVQTKLYLHAAKYTKPETWVIDSGNKKLLATTYAADFIANAAAFGSAVKYIEPYIINPLIVLRGYEQPSALHLFFEHSTTGGLHI